MSLQCFLALCFLTSCLVSGETTKYGLLGQEVTFTTNLKDIPDDILWKHNLNKVVQFNGRMQTAYDSFKGRVSLDWHSADLNISNLRYEDSGLYELQIYLKQNLKNFQYELKVIDKVSKPNISCEMKSGNSPSKSGVQANLTCSSESRQSQSLLEFEWTFNGKMLPGPKLTIPLGDGHDSEEYSCTVKNPLTTESATFIANKCYPDKSSVPLIAGLSVAIPLVLLILIVGLCVLRHKGFCACGEADVEKRSPPDCGEGGDETKAFLDRAPTLPSRHPLGHLNTNIKNSDSTKNNPLMNELKNVQRHLSSDSEDENQTLRTSPPAVLKKPPRALDLPTNDEEHKELEEPVKDDPAGSEETSEAVLNEHSSEENMMASSSPSAPEKPPRSSDLEKERADEDERGPAGEQETFERDPADSEQTNNATSDDHNSEKNEGSSNRPPVPKKTLSAKESFKKLREKADEKKPPEEEEELLPATSEKTINELPAESENHNSEKNEGSSNRPPVPKKTLSAKESFKKLREKADEKKPLEEEEELLPATSEKTINELPAESENHNSEKNEGSSNRPPVPKKTLSAKESFRKLKEKADEKKPPEEEEELLPATSEKTNNELPAESENHNKTEEIAKPENDARPRPVVKPRASLRKNPPDSSRKVEEKQDASSDRAAGEPAEKSTGVSDPLESREAIKEGQELPTNSPETTAESGEKQVSEGIQKTDGVGDQEEHFNTTKAPQSSTSSKPDNSNTDAAEAVPDHKDKDKTGQRR